ncbi:MAG: hypothetical protein Ct9H300mP19_13290 [Dehalococcoidia bacterium]|nr:MAG: hypothetical protein Ct9H300mP19_13290 [Dehalococcoidia bacterium]
MFGVSNPSAYKSNVKNMAMTIGYAQFGPPNLVANGEICLRIIKIRYDLLKLAESSLWRQSLPQFIATV